jgi:hypothetical protein
VGAWGTGPFDNDDAVDWVATVQASDDLTVVRAALAAGLDSEYLEAPEGSLAIAAAELVAAAADPTRPGLPVEVDRWLARTGVAPTRGDRDLAIRAVLRTRANGSELADLWEPTDAAGWLEGLDELVAKLASVPSRSLDAEPRPTGASSPGSGFVAVSDEQPPTEDYVDMHGCRVLIAPRADDLLIDPHRHEVRRLHLTDLAATDLRALASWERLVDLEVDDPQLQGLDGAEHLPHLRHLHVVVGSRTLSLDALAALPHLVSFGLFPADAVSDLNPIGHLTELRRLEVRHQNPASAQRLAEVPFHRLAALEELHWALAWGSSVTLTDLSPLASLTELRHVRFVDLAVDCPLDVLHRLPNLRNVELSHPDAAAERERFAALRPDVRTELSATSDLRVPLQR